MLLTLLLAVATILAIAGACGGLAYPFTCQALERHIATPVPDYKEDEAGRTAWYQKRWALEKTRKRVGLPVLAEYGVGMLCLLPVQAMLKTAGSTSHAPMILMLVLTAALLIVGLRSQIHNSRLFEAELKRRYPYAG